MSNTKVTQEYLDIIKSYRPMDDTFMRNIFRDSPEITEMVLRILMDKQDLKVIKSETQVDLKRITGSRGLCLDVLATDDSGKKYDIEVQRAKDGADPDRARYHASSMDVENSWPGMEFDQLPKTYVVFITEKDCFGRNRAVYKAQRRFDDDYSLLGDGSCILYVNGEYRDNTDIGKLMHDFNCSNPDDMLIPMLAERTRYLKTNKKEVEHMCEQMEQVANTAVLKNNIQLVIEGDLNVEKAARKSGLSIEDFLKAKEEYEKTKH